MESTTDELIPTRYRVKIPHLLSYPIGAEAISDALKDVPQFKQLVLRFYFSTDYHLKQGTYEFIRVEYKNRSESSEWTKLGLYKRIEQYTYEIVVQPVPKVFRHKVKGLILSEALPAIRERLATHSELGRQGSYVLSFFYDEGTDAVIVERSDKLEPVRG